MSPDHLRQSRQQKVTADFIAQGQFSSAEASMHAICLLRDHACRSQELRSEGSPDHSWPEAILVALHATPSRFRPLIAYIDFRIEWLLANADTSLEKQADLIEFDFGDRKLDPSLVLGFWRAVEEVLLPEEE